MYGFKIIILYSCLSPVMMGMASTDADQRLQTEDYKKVVLPGACGFNWFSAKHKKLGKISAQSQTLCADVSPVFILIKAKYS